MTSYGIIIYLINFINGPHTVQCRAKYSVSLTSTYNIGKRTIHFIIQNQTSRLLKSKSPKMITLVPCLLWSHDLQNLIHCSFHVFIIFFLNPSPSKPLYPVPHCSTSVSYTHLTVRSRHAAPPSKIYATKQDLF